MMMTIAAEDRVAIQHLDTPFISDLDLHEAVTEAIGRLNIVREAGVNLQVTVQEGVVTLEGVVLTRIMRRAVLTTAATVPGVQKVIDRLYTDADIEVAVSQALAADPATRTAQPAIAVASHLGEVVLSGRLDHSEAARAAPAVAASVPGVRRVVNRLTT